jgi:ribosomal protein S18 acetylase RimI-like enzyme
MAALPDSAPGYVVDLRSISAPALNSLLEEEGAIWRKDFSWDFRASADLVRKFVDLKALTGFALVRGNEVVGYSYYVCEEGKGLIGDLYVRPFPDQMQDENQLLAAVMEALWRTPGTTRIEAQLMMLRNTLNRAVPYPTWFRSYPRRFYEASLESMASVGPQRQILGIHIIPWSEMKQEESADLIARSYVGHIDSEINDQYRSAAGARRFLTNIIQYPGCGSFFGPASFLAVERITGAACGLCLASVVSEHTGHITQLCVAPKQRDMGLGRELLRRSLESLSANGARRVSLTVTSRNTSAIALYESMGFRNQRDFAAYVWQARSIH